jgi:hypothetical protein
VVAVVGLLAVGACVALEPVDEEILVFLQDRKLSKNDVSLVKAFGLQPLPENLSDSGQIGDGLVAHGLGHEFAMLLKFVRVKMKI